MSTLISVIIPLFNCEKFIKTSIESVLNQTYSLFEIIVVNDGSTDSSLSIVNSIKDDRIKVITRSNGGLAQARNTGIKNARGEFVGFLDADDCWHPQKLALHEHHLRNNPQVGLSFSYSQFFTESGDDLPYYQISKTNNIQAKDILLKNPIGNGSTVFVRKSLINEVSLKRHLGAGEFFNRNLRQSEDIECWLKISLETNWSIEGIPYPLTYYRVNNLGLSSNLLKQYNAWIETLDIIREDYPEFIANYFSLAESYYLRYLSRRAYASRKKGESLNFFVKSIKSSPLLLAKDPLRSFVTLMAILLSFVLPSKILDFVEIYSMGITGKQQKKRMLLRQAIYNKVN